MNKKARWHCMGCFGKAFGLCISWNWNEGPPGMMSTWAGNPPITTTLTWFPLMRGKFGNPRLPFTTRHAQTPGTSIWMGWVENIIIGLNGTMFCYQLSIIRCQQLFPMMAECSQLAHSRSKWLVNSTLVITPTMCKNVRLCSPTGCKAMKGI